MHLQRALAKSSATLHAYCRSFISIRVHVRSRMLQCTCRSSQLVPQAWVAITVNCWHVHRTQLQRNMLSRFGIWLPDVSTSSLSTNTGCIVNLCKAVMPTSLEACAFAYVHSTGSTTRHWLLTGRNCEDHVGQGAHDDASACLYGR